MAMSADLGSTLENYVSKLVEQGRYNSKSEVLREGVRLVQERESRLAALDEMVAVAMINIPFPYFMVRNFQSQLAIRAVFCRKAFFGMLLV